MDEQKFWTIEKNSLLYPSAFQMLSDAPSTLYAVGNVELLKERCFTVVGSRRTPELARKLCEGLTKELSYEFCIVTGVADGGDVAAIKGALLGSGKVICVHAGGLDCLPSANSELLKEVAKKGLILSPYPPSTPVRNFSFEYRNKLLAALGEGTLVVSAGEKSGTLITARHAKRLGKMMFAFPYPPNAAQGVGCNALIKEGGMLTETAQDIFSAFRIERKEKAQTVVLTELEERVLTALKELQEAHAAEIAKVVGIPPFRIGSVLSALEMKGLVVSLGGNRFAAV